MKIFISHKSEDKELAEKVHIWFQHYKVPTYLDTRDPDINPTDPGLTDYLIEQIGNCTHLLPIITLNTIQSWWVPFEIGIGTEKGLVISIYIHEKVEIPAYLKRWPYLKDASDVFKFSELAKRVDFSATFSENKVINRTASNRRSDARTFERELKNKLGQ